VPAIIVLGDKTNHGGEVIEASGVTDTHGKRMARVGDRVQCPKKGHGATVIIEGDLTFVIDGKAVAYHGCKTSCGAILISSQAVTTVSFGGGGGGGAAPAAKATQARQAGQSAAQAVAAAPLAPAAYDLRFLVNDDKTSQPLAGIPYKITLDSGEEFTGVTDASGHTQTVGSDAQRIAYLEAPYYGNVSSSPDTHHEHSACGC